jgi:hypothetical protein
VFAFVNIAISLFKFLKSKIIESRRKKYLEGESHSKKEMQKTITVKTRIEVVNYDKPRFHQAPVYPNFKTPVKLPFEVRKA